MWLPQMGAIVDTLLPPAGKTLWFVVIILYLYGDLAIYAVFIPDTLKSVFPEIIAGNWHLKEDGVYYCGIILLAVFVAPLAMFSLRKTMLLQITTMITRNVVFWIVVIAAFSLLTHPYQGEYPPLPVSVDGSPPVQVSCEPSRPPLRSVCVLGRENSHRSPHKVSYEASF